jgi:serine/threonine protein kinase/Tol biopolymer transport system component
MIGKTLAHYEITSKIGKGGMGEVYQAKDQKLGRNVAIKVLPEEFARDADRVARFQREAKALASLNHPNIAAIYGLEESGGTNFLVLELVPGDTLADRLKRGPIPVEESLKLGLQIAEALEAAHEKGIIHRDLKPANIKVTPEGKVKVLDFGLAKAFAGEQGDLNLSNSPTLSDAATQKGVILGTAAYMSPEQAKGKSVDKRADIWAFGAVLLEMLTGRQIFAGETVSETLAAVLMKEADFSTLPPTLHPRIRFLLERCLEKEPKNRYHDISDVRVDIQKVLTNPSGVLVRHQTAGRYQSKLRLVLPWVATAVVVAAILVGAAVWVFKPAKSLQVTRFSYELPKDQQFSDLGSPALAISPDGKQLVYSTPKGLYLRPVDELEAKLIAGTEGDTEQPFFSPDGKWIGYFSPTDRKMKKISVDGGAPVTLCGVVLLAGASWGTDDTIVYCVYPNSAVTRISAHGGTPENIVRGNAMFFSLPQILPDGKSILYTSHSNQVSIRIHSLKSGESKELFAGTDARFLPTGHIVYEMEHNLLAVPFDPDKLEVIGGYVPIVEGVYKNGPPQYAVSDSGTLAYIPGKTSNAAEPGRTLLWVDRNGKEEVIEAPSTYFMFPKISPDGTLIAYAASTGSNIDIWMLDLDRKTRTRLTFDSSQDLQPIWTSDGKRIVFASNRAGEYGIYWKASDGTGKDEKLGSMAKGNLMPFSWSKDGKSLVIQELLDAMTTSDIGMLSMEGERTLHMLLQEEFTEVQPQISPNGRWMAYCSSESGQNEIFVRPFPEVNSGRWQVSTSGGDSPRWSPDGRELFYLIGNTKAVMAVSVETEPTFKFGTPKILFSGTYIGALPSDGIPYDISPDGKRFLMMKEPTASPASTESNPRKINIVLNWFEELKQRVPAK